MIGLTKHEFKYDYKYLENYFKKEYTLDRIEKDYFKYIDDEYFISIDKKEDRKLLSLIKQIDKIVIKAYDYYFEDINSNLTRFAPFLWYLRNSYPIWEHFIWRYDILIDEKSWDYKFLETNANTPWMITEIYNISKLQKPTWYINQASRYVRYTKEFFSKYKWKKIWILLPYSFEDEDYLIGIDYYKMISEILWEENVIVWDIYESNIVEDRLFFLKWEKIDVILSFFPLEFFLSDLDYSEWFFNVIRNWWCILHNPLESIILQDKLIFAIIYENIDKFTNKEKDLIKKHIPFTTREFQEDENRFIAKARFWRISRDVFDSSFHTHTRWIDEKEFIFQEKIESMKLTENWDFVVLGWYTNYNKSICLIWRRWKNLITKDENTRITLLYTKQ